MRKLTIEVESPLIDEVSTTLFEYIERMDWLEMLTIDMTKGVKIGVMDIITKEGFTLDDVKFPPGGSIIDVLKQEGRCYTVVFKGEADSQYLSLVKGFDDLNLIFTSPTSITKERVVLSCMGSQKDLNDFILLMKNWCSVKILGFKKAEYYRRGLLTVLTERQREVLVEAKRSGYFNQPRGVGCEDLAKNLGLSRATTAEHLQKAQNKIMNHLLETY